MGGGGDDDVALAALGLEGATTRNAVDFLPGVSLQSFAWRAIGQALGTNASDAKALTGRARFTVRPGGSSLVTPRSDEDAAAAPAPPALPRSTVIEGAGDLAATMRLDNVVLNISACNLTLRAGRDDPLTAFRAATGRGARGGDALAAAAAAAGLRLTAAALVGTDTYAGIGYDLAARRPELSLCWTGETFTERAALSVHADPVERALRLRAAVSFPGPEWRGDTYDEYTGLVEFVQDDGGRHALWVEHEARQGNALLATRAGARLDVGRALNWLAAFVDLRVRPRLPRSIWRVPGVGAAYNFVVPPEDEDQFRYRIRGWELDVACADASRPAQSTRLALARRLRLAPRRAAGLVGARLGAGGEEEDSEQAVLDEAEARLAALAERKGAGGGSEAEQEAIDATLAVAKRRAAEGRAAREAAEAASGRGGRRGARGRRLDDPEPSAAERRAARRRLIDAGYSLSEDEGEDGAGGRYGHGLGSRFSASAGVPAAVAAVYDVGTGALGAELRVGSALRAVAGLGALSRSGGFTAAPSLTLSIEPLALF